MRTHLSKRICASNTNIALCFDLICCKMSRFCLLALRILAFFPCNPKTCLIIVRLSLYTSRSDIFGNFYKSPITVAILVNFDRSNVHAGYQNTKIIIESFADNSLQLLADQICFSIQMNNRDVLCSWDVRHNILRIADDSITDLLLEILQRELCQPMQFDELSIVLNLKSNCSSHRDRNTEIGESWICNFEVRNCEPCLNDAGKIDEINLRLERSSAVIGKSNQISQNRKVLCICNAVERTFNKVLQRPVAMLVDKYCNLTVFDTEGRTPADGVFPFTVSACWTPLPN